MTLAEELAKEVYATMPAAMPCNSVFALALVKATLERAAQECVNVAESVWTAPEYKEAGRVFATKIRALMDAQHSEEQR